MKWSMVIHYRSLNEKTGDAYLLHNIADILEQLGGAKYFSVINLASGTHQITVNPKSQAKTALYSLQIFRIHSNTFRVEKRAGNFPTSDGSDYFKAPRDRSFRLYGPYCHLCLFL